MKGELHLFVLWEKARFAEKRILADMARELEIVCMRELRFDGDPMYRFRQFYGPALPDARRKVSSCGVGPFLLVVVRDSAPAYGTCTVGGCEYRNVNVRLVQLKRRYRNWSRRRHRVHGTTTRAEFARDVLMLTGHTADEWAAGEPQGEWRMRLPDVWLAVSGSKPFAANPVAPGAEPVVEDSRVFLENKYINDTFIDGTFRGTPCIVKKTTKAVWSIGNEYRLACRMYAAAPTVVPRPLGWYYDCAAHAAAVLMAKVSGPSLTELLARGVTDAQADGFAADIRALAEALKREGILHRDLFSDNLLLDSDGHLKAIDWQLAIDRARYREDPWVTRHWKFHYVVFGVNRELGLGVWNDFHALGKVLALLPQTAAVKDVAAGLAAETPQMTFAAPPDRITRLKLRLYALSLRVQMFFNRTRPEKHARLRRRWRTIMDPRAGQF